MEVTSSKTTQIPLRRLLFEEASAEYRYAFNSVPEQMYPFWKIGAKDDRTAIFNIQVVFSMQLALGDRSVASVPVHSIDHPHDIPSIELLACGLP